MSVSELGLALLSGVLSTLSPCVLPLLPIVLGTALQTHPRGPLALGLGLTLTFTGLGLLVATVGLSLGLDATVFRQGAGTLMLAFGLVMLIPPLQARFAQLASGLANRGSAASGQLKGDGLTGQFAVGLLLGAIWTPCVGPTLGAAATLASSGQNLPHAALVMLVFGLGAALPLIVLGTLSQQSLSKLRGRLFQLAHHGKQLLGLLFVLIGAGILTGFDHRLEAFLVAHSPDWLTALTTRF